MLYRKTENLLLDIKEDDLEINIKRGEGGGEGTKKVFMYRQQNAGYNHNKRQVTNPFQVWQSSETDQIK